MLRKSIVNIFNLIIGSMYVGLACSHLVALIPFAHGCEDCQGEPGTFSWMFIISALITNKKAVFQKKIILLINILFVSLKHIKLKVFVKWQSTTNVRMSWNI